MRIRDMRPAVGGVSPRHGTEQISEICGHSGPVDGQDLDRRVLAKLQVDLGGNPLALLQIIRLFVDALDDHAAQIDDAVRDNELVMVARYARHMRPGAELLGATALAGILTAFEEFAESGDLAACQQLTDVFAHQVARSHTVFDSVVVGLDVVPAGRT